MIETEWPVLWGHVRDDVSVVGHTPLVRPCLVRETCVVLITNAGHTKVDHIVDINARLQQPHTGELGNSSAQRMTCSLNFCISVDVLEAQDLSNDFTADRVGRLLEAIMDTAIALGPCTVRVLIRIKVSQGTIDIVSTLKHHID